MVNKHVFLLRDPIWIDGFSYKETDDILGPIVNQLVRSIYKCVASCDDIIDEDDVLVAYFRSVNREVFSRVIPFA